MVKNEADIIEESVRNLFDQGVDHVLVADNGSTDSTPTVLRALSAELPVHVVTDPVEPYWQGEKMSHLARVATRMGASWIVPFDADELWKGTDGNSLAEVLQSSPLDFVEASWWDFVPLVEGEGIRFAERHPYRKRDPRPQVKVAFRANWLARIWMGNHHVTVPRPTIAAMGLRIAHFQLRSPAQLIRKASDGARASRLAGESADISWYWFTMEDATEERAAEKLRELVNSDALVHDPATLW